MTLQLALELPEVLVSLLSYPFRGLKEAPTQTLNQPKLHPFESYRWRTDMAGSLSTPATRAPYPFPPPGL